MKVSRREFVSIGGCAFAASLCATPSFALSASNSGAKVSARCTLLNLESDCALPESLAGLRSALGSAHRGIDASDFQSNDLGDVVIVAAAGSATPESYSFAAALLARGARVLWESGAAFLDSRAFAMQRDLVREHFGISMERPVDVWAQYGARKAGVRKSTASETNVSARSKRAIGHERIPYIAYRWPREAHVRDFSRVIPVSASSGHAIAHWGEIPVAWSKHVANGMLVFLGSPIGPALRARDSDAASLLRSMIAV